MDRIIKTDRLVLRPVTFDDAPVLSKLAGEYDIARMTGSIPSPFPVLSAEIRTLMFESAWRRGLEYSYALSQDGGEMMGIVSLFRRSDDADFELGYWLGRPYWGHGYMTEACKALLTTAEKHLDTKRLTAGVFEDNPGSMRILEKLGFKFTGQVGRYFSIARLGKANSLSFVRQNRAVPLRSHADAVIETA